MQFQYINDENGTVDNSKILMVLGDQECPLVVPNDPKNRHWQLYQQWLEEGNTPLPA